MSPSQSLQGNYFEKHVGTPLMREVLMRMSWNGGQGVKFSCHWASSCISCDVASPIISCCLAGVFTYVNSFQDTKHSLREDLICISIMIQCSQMVSLL